MSNSFFISWFIVMFPLVISPGPANIVFAASGIKYGVKKSLPLMFGVDLVLVIKSLIIGFGLGVIIEENPNFLSVIQIIGAFYLFYLSYTFFSSSKKIEKNEEKKLGFIDGIIIQIFNVKGWILVTLMFSLFGSNDFFQSDISMVLLLVFMLNILNMTAHLIWISFSSYVIGVFLKNKKVQSILFSGSLFFVGVWFLYENHLLKGLL